MTPLDRKMAEEVCFVGFTRDGVNYQTNRVRTFGEARHFITFNCSPSDKDIRIFYFIPYAEAEDVEVVVARLDLTETKENN
ncbi:putative transcriptional regulator [Pseudomonas phage YH30]|uniref:Putative transcriptional regulator n=1 Tax=Pseudomonas phage YH30 TaxID=1636189 RepID=A0A0E3T9Q9_9CAUD|nr:putative transcriptional regulator [Pseudomonas phage YH30]AKC04755.1 putative transcriptional regulator [Pseudomonas phage YH30]